MKKLGFKKLIGKNSTGIIVTILAFVITIGAIFTVSNLTLAKDTLPGIENIRNELESEDGVYTVLEIVPNLQAAQFGYLVGGEEPLDINTLYDSASKDWISWQQYFTENSDTMDESARVTFLNNLVANNADYISIGQPSSDKPMWYKPYIETGVTADDAEGVLYGGSVPVYGWLVSDDTKGVGWNAKLTNIENKTYSQLMEEKTPYYIVDTVRTDAEVAVTQEAINNSAYPDYYYTYKKDVTGAYYIPSITFGELKADFLDGGLVDENEELDDLANYFILKFKVLEEADYTGVVGPKVYMASDFVYVESGAPYVIPKQTSKGHSLTRPSDNIYYQGGLYSNEMFKQYSMDIDLENVANYKVDVQSMTPGDLNALSAEDLAAYLANVDFVYLNAGNSNFMYDYTDPTLDLSVNVVKLLFEKICNQKTPCIVDYYLKELAVIDRSLTNANVYALLCMLMQKDYRDILTGNELDVSDIDRELNNWSTKIANNNINDYNYVNGNVMVINSTLSNNRLTDSYYGSAYAADVVSEAYQAVLDEINLENLYRSVDQTAGYESFSTEIHKGTVVRYIMNYVSARTIEKKTVINVLEIQPAKVVNSGDSESETSSTEKVELKPSVVKSWMGIKDNSVTVNITTMTTNEFVGKIEDINSEYDMIYIGADVYYLPGGDKKTTVDGVNDYWTNYVDDTMDQMIYTNVGDLKAVRSQFAGQIDTDYKEGSNKKVVKNNFNTRFSGNDISADKHNALVDYVKATYPIVVADRLTTDNNTPSTVTLDDCTYIYSFLEKNLSKPNVFRVSEVKDGKNTEFQFYGNRAKLSIGNKVVASGESAEDKNAFVQPGTLVSNNDPTNGRVTYITKEYDGKFYLRYKFTITNNGAVYSNTKYTATLYLDSNSDGKYSEKFETLPDIVLTHVATGKVVKNGELIAGEQYTLTKQVPEEFRGLLNWKVEVSQTTNPYIRDSIIGYTKLSDDTQTAETIKVLHVYKDGGSVLNLEKAIGNTKEYNGNNDILEALVWGGEITEDGTTHKFDGITKDFKFEFTSIKNKDFNDSYETGYLHKDGTKTTTKFNLMDYDMFVLGFYDSYSLRDNSDYEDIDAAAINGKNGIKEFIDSGKSVLFAHDTTSFIAVSTEYTDATKTQRYYKTVKVDDANNTNIYDYGDYTCAVWAYTLNKNIRDMVGLDAYGVSLKTKDGINYSRLSTGVALKDTDSDTTLKDSLTNTLNEEGHYTIGLKKLAYKPGSSKTETVPELHGLTYPWAEMWDVTDSVHYRKDTSRYANVTKAERVNEGQITVYPYYVNQTIKTASTHAQYFFLDLNADDDNDNETDLVVWYTLSGANVYDSSPRDVVNNYYIYNKGNITYTGIGHSANSTTVEEGKLFINTMVAAYNAGKKEPVVTVYESEENMLPTYTFYEYGDAENDVAFRAGTQKMYFSISDTNVMRGDKKALVEYAVALKPGTVNANDKTYTVNGKTYEVYTSKDNQKYIILTDELVTYSANGQKAISDNLKCGELYYVDIPISVFGIPGVNEQNVNTFMVVAKTIIKKTGSITGTEMIVETDPVETKVDFVHVELFPLD